MDLRNLSSTPNQLDLQRRPSLSSLSSTSGYASSSFGMNPVSNGQQPQPQPSSQQQQPHHHHQQQSQQSQQQQQHQSGHPAQHQSNVPIGSNSTSTTGPSAAGVLGNAPTSVNTSGSNTSNPVNGINPSGVSNAWFSGNNPINDVTPWVEQQKQQQSNVGSLNLGKERDLKKSNGSTSSGNGNDNANTPGGTPITAAAVVAAAAGVSGSPNAGNSVSGQGTSSNAKLNGINGGTGTPSKGGNTMGGPTASTTTGNVKRVNSATGTPGINKPNGAAKKSNDSSDDADDDNDDDDIDDDELIPTAIVIKNIPFAIKKEQLLDVMTKLSLPLPYAFNYHFDNGVFRGLAFANFTSTDETSLVVNQLNGREIGGRKLRVEYKKMLPAQERERIEREKREKRGQLEEQHRSTSNASLASLMSATSTTAATKNLSVNGINQQQPQERMFLNFPSSTNFNFPTNLPPDLNFNDLEVLELFVQLVVFKDENSHKTLELAYPPNLSLSQRKVLSSLCGYLNLLELYDNGLIIIRRKPGQFFQALNPINNPNGVNPTGASNGMNMNLNGPVPGPGGSMGAIGGFGGIGPLGSINNSGGFAGFGGLAGLNGGGPGGDQTPHSSASMMNLNQLNTSMNPILGPSSSGSSTTTAGGGAAHPELLRSQSQSALGLPRMRQQQNSTPVQQQFPQYSSSNSVTPHSHTHGQSHSGNTTNGPGSVAGSAGGHSHSSSQTHGFPPHGNNGKGSLYQGIQPFAFMPQNQQPLMPNQLNTSLNSSSSAAAILRNGSSSGRTPYGDIRSTPPLSNAFTTNPTSAESPTPTPLHTHSTLFSTSGAPSATTGPSGPTGSVSGTSTPTASNVLPVGDLAGSNGSISEGNDINDNTSTNNPNSSTNTNGNPPNPTTSQPSTPLQPNEINSTFAPFGQHSQLTSSLSSLPSSNISQPPRHSEDSTHDLSGKFNSFNINYDGGSNPTSTTGSGIWGPK